MKSATYLNWFKRLLVLGAVVGIGALASSAWAVGRPPDVQDAAATLRNPPADVVERYAATHQSGSGTQSSPVSRMVMLSRPAGRSSQWGAVPSTTFGTP